MDKQKGFTLVELIGVIAILGIILGIGIPVFLGVSQKVNESIYETKKQNLLASAEIYAEETGKFLFSVQTLVKEGKIEADNELGEYKDPRSNRNMSCDVLRVLYENNQYLSELITNDTCYDEDELESLYGIMEINLYQNGQKIQEINGWVGGDKLELRYEWKEGYTSYEPFLEEVSWSGEVEKKCSKENLEACQNYEIEVGEIKTVQITFHGKIIKDGVVMENTILKMIRMDHQIPYVVPNSLIQNTEINTKQERKVEFDLSDGDGSGIKEYALITGNNCQAKEYEEKKKTTTQTHITEFLGNGTYHICVKDQVANQTQGSNGTLVEVSQVDATKPLIERMTIQSKSSEYASLDTRVQMEVTDDMGQGGLKMCLSETGYLEGCSWEPFQEGRDWLFSGGLDGNKRIIYLTIQDEAGNITERMAEYTPYLECQETNKTNYSGWGICSATCGGGTKTRTYTSTDRFTNKACSNGQETESCNTMDCCSSKKISSYGAWKGCSKSCGGGIQYWDVNYVSNYNGGSCGTVTNGSSQSCNTGSCCPTTSYGIGSSSGTSNGWYQWLNVNATLSSNNGLSSIQYCRTTTGSCTPTQNIGWNGNVVTMGFDSASAPQRVCTKVKMSNETCGVSCSGPYYVDSIKPTATISTSCSGSDIVVSATGSYDNQSGLMTYYYSKDGVNWYSSSTSSYTFMATPRATVYVKVRDWANNESNVVSQTKSCGPSITAITSAYKFSLVLPLNSTTAIGFIPHDSGNGTSFVYNSRVDAVVIKLNGSQVTFGPVTNISSGMNGMGDTRGTFPIGGARLSDNRVLIYGNSGYYSGSSTTYHINRPTLGLVQVDGLVPHLVSAVAILEQKTTNDHYASGLSCTSASSCKASIQYSPASRNVYSMLYDVTISGDTISFNKTNQGQDYGFYYGDLEGLSHQTYRDRDTNPVSWATNLGNGVSAYLKRNSPHGDYLNLFINDTLVYKEIVRIPGRDDAGICHFGNDRLAISDMKEVKFLRNQGGTWVIEKTIPSNISIMSPMNNNTCLGVYNWYVHETPVLYRINY